MIAALWTFFIPLYILGFLTLLLGIFVLLGRVAGGRYLRAIVGVMSKVPILKRLLTRASRAALGKQNPELASALGKLERAGALNDPKRAQAALSRLTPAERTAWMDAANQQGALPEPANREQRRRLERMRKQQQQRGGR